jgi:hypothetical protein
LEEVRTARTTDKEEHREKQCPERRQADFIFASFLWTCSPVFRGQRTIIHKPEDVSLGDHLYQHTTHKTGTYSSGLPRALKLAKLWGREPASRK